MFKYVNLLLCIMMTVAVTAQDITLDTTDDNSWSGTVTYENYKDITVEDVTVVSGVTLILRAKNSVVITDDGFTVADGGEFEIEIMTNVAPVGNTDSFTLDEGAAISPDAASGVGANDTDADSIAADLVYELVTPPSYHSGTFTLNSDGSFTYTHDGSENTGTDVDSFTYKVKDEMDAYYGGGSGTAVTANITVNAVNDPPTADASNTAAYSYPSVVTTLDGTASDDPDSTETYAWVQTAGPTVTLTNANTDTATFTPASEDTYEFTLTVDDGVYTPAPTDTVSIIVHENVLPEATDAAYFMDKNETTFPDWTLVGSDLEDSASSLTYKLTVLPRHGDVYDAYDDSQITSVPYTFSNDNDIYYDPDGTYEGIDDMYFTVTDSQSGVSEAGRIRVHVGGSNSAPVAADDTYEFYLASGETDFARTALQGVMNNDYDPDGAPITATYKSGNGPTKGNLTFNSDGSFTYTPDPGETGTDTFDYEITDDYDTNSKDTGTVTLTMLADDPDGTKGHSLLMNPSDTFDSSKWTADTDGYQAWYLSGVDPARIWQIDPLTGNRLYYVSGSDVYQTTSTTVTLEVILRDSGASPVTSGKPLNFTCVQDGVFTDNDKSAITVETDINGKASVTFEPDKDGIKTIMVSSPVAGNILKFKVEK